MFPSRLSVARNRHVTSFVFALATAVAVFVGVSPTDAAAQGPPAGLPGVGPVVLEGELEVLYEDDDNVGRLLHFLHRDNQRIPLIFADGFAPDLPTGTRVRVAGNLADGTVTTTSTSVSVLATSTTRTLGPQSVLVILFNFSNNTTQPFAATTVASVNSQVTNFYLENTYGQTTLSFTVVGWYTIAATNLTCDYTSWASQAEAQAINAGIDLATYDRRILAFPYTSACKWAGMGNVAGPRSWTNGSYVLRTIAHEQGHNFGDHHSKAKTCDVATCTIVEYGDDRDIMGATVGHMNAFQKERLGWLNYGNSPGIQTVAATGDYWIDNYEITAGYTKALRIWNPETGGLYYVESRTRVGVDSSIAAGVTVHSTVSSIGYQVDLAPLTTTYDSTLDVGQVFTDVAIGLSIQTLSTGVSGALIRVSLTTAECVPQSPNVSIAASGFLRYTVTVANTSGSTCAASAFALSALLPNGWSASFSPDASPSLAPGQNASRTLTLVAPSGASGTYPFTATATDASSGLTGSATGSVLLAAGLDVTASASLLAGNGKGRTASITVTVKVGTLPVPGAVIVVVVTNPLGATTTLNATAGADGSATVKQSIKPRDPTGTYQVLATATGIGATGTATTGFTVP